MNTDASNESTVAEETSENKPLEYSLDIREVSPCERHVTVTIPRSEIERYFQSEFDELAPKAEIPGFRIGRAPRSLVENKFRKQIAQQVKGKLLMDALSKIAEEDHYSAIGEPDIDIEQVKIPDEGDMTFEFNIEVRPEFETPDWKGLKLDIPEHEFTDEEIESHIRSISNAMATLAPVDEPVQLGDHVVCNIRTRLDGKVIAEYEELQLKVNPKASFADASFENFGELLVGSKAGDTLKTTTTLSEYTPNESVQGKEVEVEIEILDVKREETPSLDEVAAKIGLGDEQTLKSLMRESLNDKLEYAQREKVREQITKLLTESADWDLPPDLLKRQARRELDRAAMELRSSGFSEEEVTSRLNSIRQNILERTERLLKEHFILEKIAEENNVEDAPEDYEMEILKLAKQRGESPRRIRAKLERTGQMDALRNMIIENKVIDLIKEHAEFNPVPFDELSNVGSSETALNLFLGGEEESTIPEAKYEEGEPQPLPTTKERD